MFLLANYVHDLDPIIVSFGALKLRWYGMAYLAGFIGGWWLLKIMSERKLFPIEGNKISDFIAFCAIFGVFIGGRLGYVLFYMLPSDAGRAQIANDPLIIFKVWEGGMASHGGILGIALSTYYFARKNKLSWTALGDGIVCVAPLGIFFGRVANFINGELFGHVAKGVSWAVKFPEALFTHGTIEQQKNYHAAMFDAIAALDEPLKSQLSQAYETGANPKLILAEAVQNSEAVQSALSPHLLPRHPSQLYEAAVEGLFLFAVLNVLRFRYPKLPSGLLTGLFFCLYALGRIFVEQFRLPDSAMIGVLTKGQFYSIFIFLIGLGFLAFAWKRGQAAAKRAD